MGARPDRVEPRPGSSREVGGRAERPEPEGRGVARAPGRRGDPPHRLRRRHSPSAALRAAAHAPPPRWNWALNPPLPLPARAPSSTGLRRKSPPRPPCAVQPSRAPRRPPALASSPTRRALSAPPDATRPPRRRPPREWIRVDLPHPHHPGRLVLPLLVVALGHVVGGRGGGPRRRARAPAVEGRRRWTGRGGGGRPDRGPARPARAVGTDLPEDPPPPHATPVTAAAPRLRGRASGLGRAA